MSLESFIEGFRQKNVELVAVTKNHEVEEIKSLIDMGVTTIGENRISEAKTKFQLLPKDIEKHYIGHLQSNKIKEIVRLFDVIQSVYSLKHLKIINDKAYEIGKKVKVFLQINISGETQKGGILLKDFDAFVHDIPHLSNVEILGFMGMAENTTNETILREQFSSLYKVYELYRQKNLSCFHLQYLSMGMSQDYEIAIEEGSNMVRIGRLLFDLLKKP